MTLALKSIYSFPKMEGGSIQLAREGTKDSTCFAGGKRIKVCVWGQLGGRVGVSLLLSQQYKGVHCYKYMLIIVAVYLLLCPTV